MLFNILYLIYTVARNKSQQTEKKEAEYKKWVLENIKE